ncbi:MAG: hypothetical protein BGO56_12460 [Sphingobacteriales bacterium 48-107]|nr:MAG: hypothetical protein BGO56_12460 [Sphingobacteriales bacterium 48-107]
MTQRKPYNPNTAYGRRKRREEHQRWKNSLPPEERAKFEADTNFWGCLIVVFIIIIALVIGFATGNEERVFKWLSR